MNVMDLGNRYSYKIKILNIYNSKLLTGKLLTGWTVYSPQELLHVLKYTHRPGVLQNNSPIFVLVEAPKDPIGFCKL